MTVATRFGLSALVLALSACANNPDMKTVEVYEEQLRLNPPSTAWIDREIERLSSTPSTTNGAIITLLSAELNARGYREAQAEWKRVQVEKQYRTDLGNSGRGGAIHRQPGYIHTLGPQKTVQAAASSTKMAAVTQTFAIPGTNVHPGKGYSHYELSRWRRFCDEGKGMDKTDWLFIRKEGAHNVPRDIFPDCKPPANAY